jgi:hypothetical protein
MRANSSELQALSVFINELNYLNIKNSNSSLESVKNYLNERISEIKAKLL